MSKGQTKGRYICKVGFYDIYAKDTMKPKSDRESKPQVAKTEYIIYHSKKLIQAGFLNKLTATEKATELMSKHKVKA